MREILLKKISGSVLIEEGKCSVILQLPESTTVARLEQIKQELNPDGIQGYGFDYSISTVDSKTCGHFWWD